MSPKIHRIGIYWYPPEPLKTTLEETWTGKYNTDQACALISTHCGDCPVWGAHATLLDAISILEDQRPAFITAMSVVLQKYLPITLNRPKLWDKWSPNVFIRWDKDSANTTLKSLRVELMARALDFAVLEQVTWENCNDLQRTIDAMDKAGFPVQRTFLDGFEQLKKSLTQSPLSLIHAPNVPLDWYVQRLGSGGSIESGRLPFPPDPHISVATAVRDDPKIGLAKDVQQFIMKNLPSCSAWSSVFPPQHVVDCAYIVEPELMSNPPITVTVIDRITNEPREELRQKWVRRERLPKG